MKRDRQQIIAAILKICQKGALKTRIVYQANLNFRSVDEYLKFLIKNDLIEVIEGVNTTYKTTSSGLIALEKLNEANDLFAKFILPDPGEK